MTDEEIYEKLDDHKKAILFIADLEDTGNGSRWNWSRDMGELENLKLMDSRGRDFSAWITDRGREIAKRVKVEANAAEHNAPLRQSIGLML